MNEPLRIISAIITGIVYTGLMIEKSHRIRSIRKSEQAEGTACNPDPGNDPVWKKQQRRILWFGLLRLGLDCLLLLGFILSHLWPAWFGLFSGSALMAYTACAILITVTLIISVLIDWFPIRKSYLCAGSKAPPFSRFLVQQLASILRIESVMAVVWFVFLALEPTGLTVIIKTVIAVLVVLLLRGLQDLIGKQQKDQTKH